MTLSFRTRLLFTHAIVVLATFAIGGVVLERAQRRELEHQRIAELTRSARALAAALPAQAEWDSLADALGAMVGSRVTLMDRTGQVIGDSEVPRSELARIENHAHRSEMKSALQGQVGHAVRRSRTVGHDLVYVAAPVPSAQEAAVIRVAAPLSQLAALERSFHWTLLGAAGLALLLGAPIVLWVTGRQSNRVAALGRVARRLAAGEAGARASESPGDELGHLGRTLNELARESSARFDALARERDERERILAHLMDGVALLDGNGRIQQMNRSFASLLGRSLPRSSGIPLPEYARVPELAALIEEARAEGRTMELDVRLWSPAKTLHVTATPLAGPAGGVLLVLHDLTDTERLERVRQDFVANVSHELRTPLTSLRGYAETLLDGGLDDVVHREGFVRVIRDQAMRLEALTRDLLVLADLERSGAQPRREPVDLRELLEQQVSAFRPRADRAGLTLELEPGEAVPIAADRGLIEQAVANLLDNAIKYTSAGGVTVRTGVEAGRAWCEVVDTGVGVPAEHLPRIFERFYRVDEARSRALGGTGLGLSIVKHVMILHGGEVTARSTVGEGSSFRLEFPVAEQGL